MAKALPSITDLGNNMATGNNSPAELAGQTDRGALGNPSAAGKEPKEKKIKKGGTNTKGKMGKGITPNSPTIYLLPEEKTAIKKLEAHILLETGETITDHQLIMAAVREYITNHYPNFNV